MKSQISKKQLTIKKLLFVFCSLFVVSFLLAPSFVFADNYGLDTAAGEAGLKTMAISKKSIFDVVGDVVSIGLSLIGIVFFLLMLYAGFKWMMAMGKSEDAEKAKETIEAAAIGLIIVLAAYAIATFVFKGLGISDSTKTTDYSSSDEGCTITKKGVCQENTISCTGGSYETSLCLSPANKSLTNVQCCVPKP